MATSPRRVVLTYADLQEMPDDRNRYEIIEGQLQVTPAPSTLHQAVVRNLALLLGDHVRRHDLGELFFAPCDVFFSEISVVEPDLMFISKGRTAIIEHAFIRGAPDLVVEVLSPGTTRRDRQAKRQLYALHGVANYWVIDPIEQRFESYTLSAGEYELAAVAAQGEACAAAPFPDLEIRLAELWR